MLVTIFLRGGADTLSLLVPHGDDAYYRARPTLSIRPPGKTDGATDLDGFYGLHPKLAPLHRVFTDGRLAFVQAVGCDDTSGSHFVAQEQIERGQSRAQSLGGGWLARYLGALGGGASLAGIAIGERIPDALRGAAHVAAMRTLADLSIDAAANPSALASLYAADPLLAEPAKATFDLISRVAGIRGTRSSAAYPEGRFGDALRETARLIHARIGLEVASIDLDGWDTHFVQGTTGGILGLAADALGKGLAAFDEDLGPERERVRIVVMTEFGRRTYENGSGGTDHGRGYAMMLIGGGLRPGIHGTYPGLEEPQIPGPGGLAVRIDYREVLSEVVRSLGKGVDTTKVFPGLPRGTLDLAA